MEDLKGLKEKFHVLAVKAAKIRDECPYPLPLKGEETVRRIDAAGLREPSVDALFTMVSDLSYFIGYMEGHKDSK